MRSKLSLGRRQFLPWTLANGYAIQRAAWCDMRKTKQSIKRAVDDYISQVAQHFPGVAFETTIQPEMGVEAWLWIRMDPNDTKLRGEVETYTSALSLRLLDEEDLNIVAIPTNTKEPVHG
jgi:hypothetical protein